MKKRNARRFGPGPAVDADGRPVIDPTSNVLDLVDAAVKRQDDLRTAETHYLREMVSIRAEIAEIRTGHNKELRDAEAKRIDAINAAQVAQVAATAAVAETRAVALAASQTVTSETLRAQVATVAQAATIALDAKYGPLDAKIAVLSQNMFEQRGGKFQEAEGRDMGANRGMWIGVAVGILALMVSSFVSVASIAVAIYFRG